MVVTDGGGRMGTWRRAAIARRGLGLGVGASGVAESEGGGRVGEGIELVWQASSL